MPAAAHDPDKAITPTPAEVRQAGIARERLKRIVRPNRPFRFAPEGKAETVEVPAAAAALLLRLLAEMAAGHAVTIIPIHAELTTREAADLLGVSRPFLIKLIDQGKLPHRMVGSHRRVQFKDVMEYQRRSETDRRAALAQLAEDAQKLGLGY